MDPLTHTATGLFLSRIGLRRWTPLATPILLLAANAPDIDIVTLAGGSANYLHFHRHLTHAFVALPVLAILPVVLVRLIARKPIHWLGAFAAASIAVLMHLLLDLTNIYGIRLLLPFSATWFRLDLTNVVDVWIWGVFLLAVAAPFVGKLVASEIASRDHKPRRHGRGFAWFALAFLLLYNCGRAVLHARALATVEARVYEDQPPARAMAAPDGIDPWNWKGVVETGDFYAVAPLHLGREFDPARAAIFRKPDPDPALDAARRNPTVSRFLEFSQFPFWRVSPAPQPEGAKLVEIFDMRFGTPKDPSFMVSALVSNRLQVIETHLSYGRPRNP
jgi:inner membrane protein